MKNGTNSTWEQLFPTAHSLTISGQFLTLLESAAYEFDDVEDSMIEDLGSGAGTLSAAALYVGLSI